MEKRLEHPQRHVAATEGLDWDRPLVSIRCTVYNHEAYLRDALEGFVMQETTFPFEAIVHDDASTDGSADIIREYAEKYPHIIKPIYQTVNQHSLKNGGMAKAINAAMSPYSCFIALCEGDDYWVSPRKLQMQTEWMEESDSHTMCWTNADRLDCRTGEMRPFDSYPCSRLSNVEDLILKSGAFVPTCSMVVRKDLYLNMPDGAKGYYCGDYPLQVWVSHVGQTYYFDEKTCVYRFMASGSWSSRAAKEDLEKRRKHLGEEKRMLEGLDKVTGHAHHDTFEAFAAQQLFWLALRAEEYDEARHCMELRDKHNIGTDRMLRYRLQNRRALALLLGLYRTARKTVRRCVGLVAKDA